MANREVLAIGNTGADLVSKFNTNCKNGNIKVFNVEDYGAVHDNETDDTAAIQAAIDAANTAGGGIIYFPVGIYVIGGTLVGGAYNSQITIPYLKHSDDSQLRKSFHLLGEVRPNFSQSFGIDVFDVEAIPPTTGVILKSTIVGSGTNPSVICGGNNVEQAIWANGNANHVIVENLQLNPLPDEDNALTIGGINLRGVINCEVRNCTAFPFGIKITDCGLPKNDCVGIATALNNNGQVAVVDNCNVGGFYEGYRVGEHASLRDTMAISCLIAYHVRGAGHLMYGSKLISHWCGTTLKISGSYCLLKIDCLIDEPLVEGGKWYDFVQTIEDTGNDGHGIVYYNTTGGGLYNPNFTKTGGVNLQAYPICFEAASSFSVTGVAAAGTLKNLLTVLAAKGIIKDSTTAT